MIFCWLLSIKVIINPSRQVYARKVNTLSATVNFQTINWWIENEYKGKEKHTRRLFYAPKIRVQIYNVLPPQKCLKPNKPTSYFQKCLHIWNYRVGLKHTSEDYLKLSFVILHSLVVLRLVTLKRIIYMTPTRRFV